jgi:ATP synthase protein I
MDQNSIGGVITGGGLGFIVDWLFGLSPWGLFIGVILGFAAGTLNVVRAAQSINRDAGYDDPGGADGS